MGVHSNAEKIVKEFGFDPRVAHATRRGTGSATEVRAKAVAIVDAMDDFLSTEGMVRIYALLRSATNTAAPKFDIGGGPKAIATEMEKRLNVPKEREAMLKEIGEMKKNLGDLEQRVKGQGLAISNRE